ncbi:hypothetical protein NKT77_10610 [Moraxella sp. FZLJ2107]|uniref:hypothetical protein n=1 Tax=unclassified Moraxella TaxID=2685852 RepID=UPI00209C19A2|nr:MULTISPECIES: hypothetical protein [unclassified Moraxella]USZ14252.1 hypothetical protein NGM44_07645 [Moraxella sp. FZFQ2102]UTO04923.1 hypothetical protein NKT77_10610 [Moraxella sp. FZLJ2107]UTO21657.1 hypothetical protein NKU06_07425 [Moraxella sp. FZLJ2109]
MSDSTKTTTINDLLAKTNKPNHLASRLEHHAAAGAALPANLSRQYHHLHQLTIIVRQALSELLPESVLADCYVATASPTELCISLSSATAVNHARYMMVNCVQALRAYDSCFCHLQSLKVILAPKPIQSDARQDSSHRTLSENTRQNIAQSAQFVTKNERLRAALLKLAQDKP